MADDFSTIWLRLPSLQFQYLVPYFFLLLGHFASEPLRWTAYMTALREARRPLTLFHVFNLGSLLSLLMPLKLGFPARVVLLTKTIRLKMDTSIGVLVLDGLMYNGIWATFAVVSLLFGATRYKPADFSGGIWLVLIFALVAIAVWNRRRRPRETASPQSVWARLGAHIKRMPEFVHNLGMWTIVLSLGVMFADVLINAAFHWFLLRVVGVELSPVAVLIATSIAMLAGIASLLPSGLGGYDVTLIILLRGFGVPITAAVLVPILNRIGILLMAMILGVTGGIVLGLNPFRRIWLEKRPEI
ncbi:MAG: lysylphosphatidylglycerol synthase transmembrane domain-containing protein [Sulfuricaulis sp.]